MKKRIAAKLAYYTILLGVITGSIASAVEIRNLYKQSTREIVATAEQLIELTLDAASEAVYQLDGKIAEDLLRGLMRNEMFLDSGIYDELGQELARVSRSRGEPTGLVTLIDIPPVDFRYALPVRDDASVFGVLTARLDVQSGLAPFYDLAIANSVAQVLQATGLSLLVFLIVIYIVTNPLSSLAKQLSKIEPGSSERLHASKTHRHDELGDLVESTNRYLDAASQHHEELSRHRQNLLDILDSLYEGVVTVNQDSEISGVNAAAQNMFGYDEAHMLGMPFTRLLAADEHMTVEETIDRVTSDDVGIGTKGIGQDSDGCQFPIELSISETELVDGPHNLWTIRDISEQAQAERDRGVLERQLRQSQKMEAIGTLAGGIAHDFNNMLASIIGFTELAVEKSAKDSEIRDDLGHVLLVSEKAVELVRQILTFGRQYDESKRPLDFASVVDECYSLIRRSVPSTIELVKEYNGTSFTIFADATMMHQVMMNLYTNAAGAIGGHAGKIVVALDHFEGLIPATAVPSILPPLGAHRQRHYVRVTLRDNGSGICADVIDRIFEPFFSTKDVGSGSGMGLAVVHSIVENHGGSIDVVSGTGGTTFTIYFPYVDEISPITSTEVGGEAEKLEGTERILVVEDDEMLGDLLVEVLTQQGYDIVIKRNGDEALAAYRAEANSFDLVVTDQTMPGKNGDELAMDIFSIRADQPIVLCTGYNEFITEADVLKMGVRRYLTKPIPIKVMCSTVRAVLDEVETEKNQVLN